MRRARVGGLLCLLVAFLVGLPLLAEEAAAFTRGPWLPFGFVNVNPAEAAIYDDMPAGVPGFSGSEAGLIIMIQNQNLAEIVNYGTINGVVFPATYPYKYLEVRAAVNDGAVFRVGYGTSTMGPCQYYPAALTISGAVSNGIYQTRTAAVTVPMNYVKRICVGLRDEPIALASGKASVLIDHIRLKTASGATGWSEVFTGAP